MAYDALKESFSDLSTYSVAVASSLIGVKAQQYDIKSGSYNARYLFSIPVNVARVTDVSLAALTSPKVEDFARHRARLYYIGRMPLTHYIRLIRNNYIIDSSLARQLVGIDLHQDSLIRYWEDPSEILNIVGKDMKNTYLEGDLHPKKREQLSAITLVSEVLTSFPDTDINHLVSPLPLPKRMSLLSRLESMRVIEKTDSGLIIPQPLLEVHGLELKNLLSRIIENPLLRYVVSLIFKFPGIGVKTLSRYIPNEMELKRAFKNILIYLQESHFIMLARYSLHNDFDLIVLPITTAYSLFAVGSPILDEIDTFRKILSILRNFWENVNLAYANNEINNLEKLLRKILKNGGFTLEDISDTHFSKIIVLIAKIGGIFRSTESDFFELLNKMFLAALLKILEISKSNLLDIPTPQEVRNASFDEIINELMESLETIRDDLDQIIKTDDKKKILKE